MATALTVVAALPAGVDPGLAAVDAAGNYFNLQGRMRGILIVQNTDASPHTVTVPVVNAVVPGSGAAPPVTLTDFVVVVPNGTVRTLGPFPASHIDSNGRVNITYSSGTGMKAAVVELPQ
jgi:hypothetical protein